MNKIEKTFKKLKALNKKALIPYIMAGDPTIGKTKELVLILESCGADIIELGVPFSDPLADGPTIQRAAERSLNKGTTLRKIIGLVKDLRTKTKIPLILMTYYNPIFKYGEEAFIKDAEDAGVDGLIIPDLPPDEADELIKLTKKSSVAIIFLLAPTSTTDRIKKVASKSRGFIYYVSMTGITGAELSIDSSLGKSIDSIRRLTDKPIAVGFGISTPEDASSIAGFSDGVIVGSAIVKKIQENSDESLREFVISLKKAVG
ncbi:MAG: tryptophan synthase subunit alpha [Nitrospiraceae bacterium]|nr:tryptophan synthase subunit alpha [Nitrospiraceae bacterium]